MTSHLPDLVGALQRRTMALFVGADLPREVTGLPSRADLARALARRHKIDESLSLSEVAQRVGQAGNRWEFTDFIRNALDASGKPPRPFHHGIVAQVKEHRIETIITTAYDNLLELAFQQAGIGINRVVRGSDVSFIRPDRPTLIKLYGDAQQPDTLVVTDGDHSDLLRDRDREPLIDTVRQAFRLNTLLFLGYNLADPDFRFLFDQIAQSRFARVAYAVWPGLLQVDVQMWRGRGIVILDTDPLQALAAPTVPLASGFGAEAMVPYPQASGTGAPSEGAAAGETAAGGAPQDQPEDIGIASGWKTDSIRVLVTAAFGEEEFITFCFDHFRTVYESFGSGMSKTLKVQLLLDYCDRHEQFETLLRLVREANPIQFEHCASQLMKGHHA